MVLLSHTAIDTHFGRKLDASSPEIALRSILGTIVDEPEDFADACQTALASWSADRTSSDALKSEFFKMDGLAADSFRFAIFDPVSRRITKTEQQEHLHRFASSAARSKLRDGRRFAALVLKSGVLFATTRAVITIYIAYIWPFYCSQLRSSIFTYCCPGLTSPCQLPQAGFLLPETQNAKTNPRSRLCERVSALMVPSLWVLVAKYRYPTRALVTSESGTSTPPMI